MLVSAGVLLSCFAVCGHGWSPFGLCRFGVDVLGVVGGDRLWPAPSLGVLLCVGVGTGVGLSRGVPGVSDGWRRCLVWVLSRCV